jgi:hypothetical protein
MIAMKHLIDLRKYAEERVAECEQNSVAATHPDEKATWLAKHVAWKRVLSIYEFIAIVQSLLKTTGRRLH